MLTRVPQEMISITGMYMYIIPSNLALYTMYVS